MGMKAVRDPGNDALTRREEPTMAPIVIEFNDIDLIHSRGLYAVLREKLEELEVESESSFAFELWCWADGHSEMDGGESPSEWIWGASTQVELPQQYGETLFCDSYAKALMHGHSGFARYRVVLTPTPVAGGNAPVIQVGRMGG